MNIASLRVGPGGQVLAVALAFEDVPKDQLPLVHPLATDQAPLALTTPISKPITATAEGSSRNSPAPSLPVTSITSTSDGADLPVSKTPEPHPASSEPDISPSSLLSSSLLNFSSPTPASTPSSGLSSATVNAPWIGTAFGSVAGVAFLIATFVWWWRLRKHRRIRQLEDTADELPWTQYADDLEKEQARSDSRAWDIIDLGHPEFPPTMPTIPPVSYQNLYAQEADEPTFLLYPLAGLAAAARRQNVLGNDQPAFNESDNLTRLPPRRTSRITNFRDSSRAPTLPALATSAAFSNLDCEPISRVSSHSTAVSVLTRGNSEYSVASDASLCSRQSRTRRGSFSEKEQAARDALKLRRLKASKGSTRP